MKKKKFQSALFSQLGRWTGNNFLFKGGLRVIQRVDILFMTWSSVGRSKKYVPLPICMYQPLVTCISIFP